MATTLNICPPHIRREKPRATYKHTSVILKVRVRIMRGTDRIHLGSYVLKHIRKKIKKKNVVIVNARLTKNWEISFKSQKCIISPEN